MTNGESLTKAGNTKYPAPSCPASRWQLNKLCQTNRWWNSSQHQRGQYKNNEQNQPGELRSFCSFPHTTAYTQETLSLPYCWRCTNHITCRCRGLNATSSEPASWARIRHLAVGWNYCRSVLYGRACEQNSTRAESPVSIAENLWKACLTGS